MPIKDEEKMYSMICSERFDKIDNTQKEIIDILKGNNGAGLCEEVRKLKATNVKVFGALGFVLTVGLLNLIPKIITWIEEIVKHGT